MTEELFENEYLKTFNKKTPFFIYSKDRLEKNVLEFKNDFPVAEVFYAMKANFDFEILKCLAEMNIGFEVASKYELDILKKLNVAPEKIIYGTAIKPIDHIVDFYEYGVQVFACDSLRELEKIAEFAPGAKVFFRIHADNKDSKIDLSEKFGATPEKALSMIEACESLGVDAYGLSFHVGSQAKNPEAWARNLDAVSKVIDRSKEKGIVLNMINIGGGYPCSYSVKEDHIHLLDIAERVQEEYKKLSLTQKIITEPGRRIVANAGVAVATVIGRSTKGEKEWLFLDLGVYGGLFEVMAYQGSTRYRISCLDDIEGDETQEFSVAGPTGDGPDVIDRNITLPKNIATGDRLIIHDIGAYSLPTICNFHAFPPPPVYLV